MGVPGQMEILIGEHYSKSGIVKVSAAVYTVKFGLRNVIFPIFNSEEYGSYLDDSNSGIQGQYPKGN